MKNEKSWEKLCNEISKQRDDILNENFRLQGIIDNSGDADHLQNVEYETQRLFEFLKSLGLSDDNIIDSIINGTELQQTLIKEKIV